MSSSLARRAAAALSVLVLHAGVAGVAGAANARTMADPPPFGPPVAGQVVNEGGQALPNVNVVVTEAGRSTTTNAQGVFEIRSLPAGVYHLTTLLIGYAPSHVVVTVPDSGAAVSVKVTMKASTVRLQSVQVTATPTGTDPLTITQSTVELSGKELNRNLGASIAQTLANEPGLAMRYNGPAANVPVIRGLTGERILVLQDGDRAGDLSSASSDHALSIDPLNAQRIEVVRGPASLLYGNNALGGVVNVISSDIPTSVPSHVQGYVAGQGESVNPGGAGSAGLTVPLGGKVVAAGRLSARSIDDFRAGGDVKQFDTYSRSQGAVAGLGYVGDAVSGGLAYRGNRFNYGLPTAAGDPSAGGHIEGRRQDVIGRTDLNVNAHGIQTIRLNGTAQWYRHDEVENTGAIGTSFDLKTQTLNATARTAFAGTTGALGLSGLLKEYASTGEEALTPAARSSNGGMFLYEEIPLAGAGAEPEAHRPHLQVGARYDLYTIRTEAGDAKFGPATTKTFNNASGSLGASVPLGRTLTLSGSVAHAFRAPTVEELFSEAFHAAVGTYDRGNPDLKAETNTGVDGILRAVSGRTSAQLSAYYNRINDFISPKIVGQVDQQGNAVPAGTDGAVPLNQFAQHDATLRGVEGQAEAEVVKHVVVGAMGDLVRGAFVEGGPLPFLPPARLGGSLRWDDGRVFAGGDVRHGFGQSRVSQPGCASADRATIGPQGELPSEPTTGTPCVDVATPDYTVANLSAGINLIVGGYVHSFTLRVDNVGDTRFYDASSRIKSFTANPGRNVSVVYKVLF